MPTDGDLLTPTLTGHQPRDYSGTQERPPWRAGSLVYGAILGGPLALLVLGPIDARRLRAPAGTGAKIAALALVCLLAGVTAAHLIGGEASNLVLGAFGLAAFGGAWLMLRSAERVRSVYSPSGDEALDFESVLAATVGAVLVAWLGSGILRSIVAELL